MLCICVSICYLIKKKKINPRSTRPPGSCRSASIHPLLPLTDCKAPFSSSLLRPSLTKSLLANGVPLMCFYTPPPQLSGWCERASLQMLPCAPSQKTHVGGVWYLGILRKLPVDRFYLLKTHCVWNGTTWWLEIALQLVLLLSAISGDLLKSVKLSTEAQSGLMSAY